MWKILALSICTIKERRQWIMKMFEYMRKDNFKELSPDQQRFVAARIMKDVNTYAVEHNISPEKAYEMYSFGLIGSDREV